MFRRAASVVPLLVVAATSGGCGTLVNQSEPGGYFALHDRPPRQPYGGVGVDAKAFWEAANCWVKQERPNCNTDPDWNIASTSALVAIDLPLSVLADTLALPFDVAYTARNWDRDVWADYREDLDRRRAGRESIPPGDAGRPFQPVGGGINSAGAPPG